MTDLPRHPDRDDESEDAATETPRRTYAAVAVVVGLLVLMVVLHLTGVVGPGPH